MSWHRIVAIQEIPPRQRRRVSVEGHDLVLLHTEDGIFCIDYHCPHTGGPLGDGPLAGSTLTCPLHHWRFDLFSGEHNHAPQCTPASVYQLKLEGEDVMVELPDKKPVPEVVT
jgi:nitrite reductase (NADH) small subunit